MAAIPWYHHKCRTKKMLDLKIPIFEISERNREIAVDYYYNVLFPHNNSTKMHQRPTKREIEMAILSYRNTNPARSFDNNNKINYILAYIAI